MSCRRVFAKVVAMTGHRPVARVVTPWCLVVGLLAGWGGCRGSGDEGMPVVLFSIDDRASPSFTGLDFSEKLLRKLLRGAVVQRGFRLLEEPAEGAFRVDLSVGQATEQGPKTTDDQEKIYRSLQVEVVFWRRTASGDKEQISAVGRSYQGQARELDRQKGFERVLAEALGKAVDWVALQLRARSLDGEHLAALLGDSNSRRRLYTLRSLRERRTPELVPRVIELLHDQDPEVALEAVGVLVAQHDQRAVLPLIQVAQGKDLLFLSQIVTAVGQLGGRQARGYLFTLAAGHSSEQIRRLAREALERLQKQPGSRRGDVGAALVVPVAEEGRKVKGGEK